MTARQVFWVMTGFFTASAMIPANVSIGRMLSSCFICGRTHPSCHSRSALSMVKWWSTRGKASTDRFFSREFCRFTVFFGYWKGLKCVCLVLYSFLLEAHGHGYSMERSSKARYLAERCADVPFRWFRLQNRWWQQSFRLWSQTAWMYMLPKAIDIHSMKQTLFNLSVTPWFLIYFIELLIVEKETEWCVLFWVKRNRTLPLCCCWIDSILLEHLFDFFCQDLPRSRSRSKGTSMHGPCIARCKLDSMFSCWDSRKAAVAHIRKLWWPLDKSLLVWLLIIEYGYLSALVLVKCVFSSSATRLCSCIFSSLVVSGFQ